MSETRNPTRTRAIISNHILIRLSAAAGCNPNTIRRYCAGLLRQQRTIDRIEESLRAAGLGRLVRLQDAAPKASDALR
jgi:hypothetical protein